MRWSKSIPVVVLSCLCWAGLAHAEPGPIFGPQTFERTAGASDLYTESFEAPTGGWFLLFLRNGDGESSRVASAAVSLNGEPIVLPADLNDQVPGLVRRARLQPGTNELSVELGGEPGSFVTVAIGRPDERPRFVHGRLLLPWGRDDGERALSLALKNGSPRFPRGVRVVFFSPAGEVVAATDRILLPPRGSAMIPVAELLENAGANWSVGSIELFWAGPGVGRLFGTARQVDLTLGQSDVQPMAQAGLEIVRDHD